MDNQWHQTIYDDDKLHNGLKLNVQVTMMFNFNLLYNIVCYIINGLMLLTMISYIVYKVCKWNEYKVYGKNKISIEGLKIKNIINSFL